MESTASDLIELQTFRVSAVNFPARVRAAFVQSARQVEKGGAAESFLSMRLFLLEIRDPLI